MSKWHGLSSSNVTNTILRPKEDNLSLALTRLGVPHVLIAQYLEKGDVTYLFNHSRDPEYVKQLVELMESSKPSRPLRKKDHASHLPNHSYHGYGITHATMDRAEDRILKCSKELKDQYIHRSNILKIALLPSTQYKIHGVEDLHVPVLLKKSEISPDIPQMADLHADSFFKGPHITKKKILLFGPPGVGKTTEIKMWLHYWCHNKEGPLKDFHVVFYVDGAKLDPGTSLGEAIINQCLPADTEFSPEDVELMCQERQDEVLVILDNYTKWRKNDQVNPTSSLEDMVLLRNFGVLTLMVATTSGGVGDFREVYGNYDHVKIEGISEESVSTYVQKVFRQRKKFGLQVEKSLHDTKLVSDMAASPLLLSIMCQIAKWCENPAVLGDLKTGSELTDMFIDCIIKHGGDGDSQVIKHSDKLENITIVQSEGNDDRSEKGEEVSSAPTSLRESTVCTKTTSLRSQSSVDAKAISKDEILKQLSAVAFGCYLKKDSPEELHLSEDDFGVCGVLKQDVIKGGCNLGLLVKSCKDELMPSTAKAAKGKVIRFLNALVQQKLAAKHLAKLHQGNDEEKQSFQSSLQKLGSIHDALSLRNLLLFACGESKESARLIIGQVVHLTQTYAEMFPDSRRDMYQYMIEFILDLNYEARSGGSLNDILRPLVTRLRILSPTVITTRALAYLLDHTATPNVPKLHEVQIEVLGVPPGITKNLPDHSHILYNYKEPDSVSVEMSALEDPHRDSSMIQPPTMGKLSIEFKPKKTKSNMPVTVAAKFPSAPVSGDSSGLPLTEDAAFPFMEPSSPPYTSNRIQPVKDDKRLPYTQDVCLSGAESTGQKEERGAMNGRRQRREIERIVDRSDYKIGDYISFGGYGEVYKALWKNKTVAVKRMKMVEKCLTDSFEREIKINALMNHPNIVVLHAYSMYQPGTTSNFCVDLIMDFIDGFTLNDAVFENKVEYLQTLPGKLTTARKVCDAIAHIHSKKCTHSDIKPDNILIRSKDNEPFVCDLGLAHGVTHSAVTTVTPGTRQGIPKWSPPESFGRGYVASCEGDVWSLACILLELFTRRRVWEIISGHGEELSVAEIVARLCGNDVTPDIIKLVDNGIACDALRSCFNRTPNERPTAKELADIFLSVNE